MFEVNPTVQPSNGLHLVRRRMRPGLHGAGSQAAWVDSNPRTTAYPFELKGGAYVSTGRRSITRTTTPTASRAPYMAARREWMAPIC